MYNPYSRAIHEIHIKIITVFHFTHFLECNTEPSFTVAISHFYHKSRCEPYQNKSIKLVCKQ